MVDVNSLFSDSVSMIKSVSGSQFFIWVILVPIVLEVIITILLRRVVSKGLEFKEGQQWLGILYLIVMYFVCLFIVFFVLNFLGVRL